MNLKEKMQKSTNNKIIIKQLKKDIKGITLIALVVTIIILLILAGVAISLTVGDNGLFKRAQNAVDTWQLAEQNEQSEMNKTTEFLEDYIASNTNFTTANGKIHVIWLDTNNNVIESPNSPADYLGGMTPVYWSGEADNYEEHEDTEITENFGNIWYNYTGIDGTEENLTSKWANAKGENGSYFVWIPRFAYRITFFIDENSDIPTGYYDGRGLLNASEEPVLININGTDTAIGLDEGIETVKYNGDSYIVHPAFIDDSTNGYSNGGWDDDLAGIWVSKYEMSRIDATINEYGKSEQIRSVPSVKALGLTIREMYTKAYEYSRDNDSHLIKNSEWGAVAYLSYSQYGRNGHEIDINNSDTYITGNGGGATNASPSNGITNEYNTILGQHASTTGNITGVYDMSGGLGEAVAAFNNIDDNNYEETFGGTFAGVNNTSTKYYTRYSNATENNSGIEIYLIGKVGDATKEVYSGNASSSWNNDNAVYLYKNEPFISRGGGYSHKTGAGVFCCNSYIGSSDGYYSGIRVVLAGV